MIVVIDGLSGSVRMQEADNVTALSIRLESCEPDQAARLLADLGRIAGDHAWLDVAGLRSLSPHAADAGWISAFESAMSYARSKGWTDEDGRIVRAHVAS